jgi:hypothetical protein
VEAKPLFRPDVVGRRVRGFVLPERVVGAQGVLRNWAGLIGGAGFSGYREQDLLPDFLSDLFGAVLGYVGPASGSARYTLSRETHVEVEGEFVDAVLGEFGAAKRPVVAVEGKGPRNPLDRPFGGRRLSAVEQGYRYATNLPCDWIVVTNIAQIRLYHKGSDQRTYERFETARFATDEEHLRRFVYLLGAERVVPAVGENHLRELLTASERAELDLTRAYYAAYAETRLDLLDRLRQENPNAPPEELLSATQKLLDRVLFCAFAEDRGLLPADTLKQAYEARNAYNPQPIWESFRGLFQAIDRGNEALGIPAYDGGLFEPDPFLDALSVPDEVCRKLKQLGDYDYRAPEIASAGEGDAEAEPIVDVDVLGHIFEQSITDLEQIRADLEAGDRELAEAKKRISRRKREGAFYTPAYITRYIVRAALGPVIDERFERLRAKHQGQAKGTAAAALEDPWVYDLAKLNEPQRKALVRFWDACLAELQTVRLLDPACGSGAFLIEAFDQFHRRYQEINERLRELRRGEPSLFDADRTILRHNLYGVDLNGEAVQIARLSVWIKTAERGKELTDLDGTIRAGNSIVDDPALDPRALEWRSAFPEVFADGGFDVVVGNPPYVRQELLGEVKPYLSRRFAAYHGMADLYVYFFERGLTLLRPGGRLSFIVTNKWMKAGYGAPLRRLFGERARVEAVIDFGHAKQIFADADVFPSIVVVAKPAEGEAPAPEDEVQVSVIPRERLRLDDLQTQIDEEGFELPCSRLGEEPWRLEPPGAQRLLDKIRERGVPLADYAGAKPYRGILTGYNNAFLIDNATRARLVAEDARAEDLIRPYLRGQDVGRWASQWAGLWMIVLKSSGDHAWPWEKAGEQAEEVFAREYPSLHKHFKPHESRLERRSDRGRHWWELRACAYYDVFDRPKITYQVIQYYPAYAMDTEGVLGNDKTFFLAAPDLYLLGVLNSPLLWWHNWRFLTHLKDEALNPAAVRMEQLPIALPGDDLRDEVAGLARKLVDLEQQRSEAAKTLLDWLRVEHEIETPGRRLEAPFELTSDELVAEVRKRRGKKGLSAAALKNLREEHAATVEPMRRRLAESEELERRLADLVHEAYGLTPEEVDLMWRTAPPRMPVARAAEGD